MYKNLYPEDATVAKREARFDGVAMIVGGILFAAAGFWAFGDGYQHYVKSMRVDFIPYLNQLIRFILYTGIPVGLLLLGVMGVVAGIRQIATGRAFHNDLDKVNERDLDE